MRDETDPSSPNGDRLRVVIIDDHRAVSEALGMAIDLQDDMVFLGAASSVEEGMTLCEKDKPDIVLMDIQMPDVDGITGTRMIKERFPEVHVLIVTGHTEPALVARGAEAGASGFLPKQTPVTEILRAVRTASDGEMLVPASVLAAVLEEARAASKGAPADQRGLTERELEVLALLGQGFDANTIAKRLTIQLSTCRGHIKSILRKLGAHSQLEAVVTATREGIIAPGASAR